MTTTTTTQAPCYCPDCIRTDCPHRGAFRRLPREAGGLGLCPGPIDGESEQLTNIDGDTVTIIYHPDGGAKIIFADGIRRSDNAEDALHRLYRMGYRF
jgi:hypothetical protein